MTESSLYERLGGAFALAAVIDRFSDAVVRNPIAGQTSENPALREWSTNNLVRLPGLNRVLRDTSAPTGARRRLLQRAVVGAAGVAAASAGILASSALAERQASGPEQW
jgi:hypothetical protein